MPEPIRDGSGLRLGEVLKLRVSGLDMDRGLSRVEAGKGQKDRYTVLLKRLSGMDGPPLDCSARLSRYNGSRERTISSK